jgi:hypothetical protein
MPIMAAQGEGDARMSARLLATMALECLTNPALAPARMPALNNVYRLLEAVRSNPFFGLERRPGFGGSAESLARVSGLERHVEDVKAALDSAVAMTFAERTRDQALRDVEQVLKAVAYPADFGQPTDEERNRAQDFFRNVIQSLRAA